MDHPAEDSRPRRLESPPVLVAIVMPAIVCVVASFFSVSLLPSPMLVDVVACVTWFMVVDDALSDWRQFFAMRRSFLVDKNFLFVSRWFDMSF